MADRILSWFIDPHVGAAGDAQGMEYVLDRAYNPRAVRISARRAPDAGHCTFDIRDDGDTIFPDDLPFLPLGQTLDEVADDFVSVSGEGVPTLERYSVVTLHFTAPNGAQGISVHLELDAAEDDDERALGDT